MDTQFAKIVTDLDGRHSLLVEGRVIGLSVADLQQNNGAVEAIVTGLRTASRLTGDTNQEAS